MHCCDAHRLCQQEQSVSSFIYYSSVGEFRGRKRLLPETETTTSRTGALLQAWEGGGAQGTHAAEMLTEVFFFIPPSSRDLSAAARLGLTTYGMVGSMNGHMTGLQEEGKAEGGGMSEGVMNTCPKWQLEELWPYRLQDM